MSNPNAPYRSPWMHDTPPFEIVPGVYYVGNKNVSCHLFDTGEGLLLLDTAYLETTYLLTESIRDLGFDPHDIKWIVHTHAHYDHFGGTRALVEKYGCKTYMPAIDLPFMQSADWTYCEAAGLPYEPPFDLYFETDVALHPGDVVNFGNIAMHCYDASGHTPGTMAYIFHMPSGLKVGMHGGIGPNTLTSEYSLSHNLGNTWRDAYGKTIKRLRGLEVDVILGNHPNQTETFRKIAEKTSDHNPFIDPTEWERMLDGCEDRLAKIVAEDPIP
ncbi:MAG: MBL fold metallo-hydrolase [Clostridiales bacterium]|nr:MBL fold metallo-hydrolase [Clostridiales bacterium]